MVAKVPRKQCDNCRRPHLCHGPGYNAGIDHEDVAMRLFASLLTEEALDWFKGLLDNHITSYNVFLTYSRAGS